MLVFRDQVAKTVLHVTQDYNFRETKVLLTRASEILRANGRRITSLQLNAAAAYDESFGMTEATFQQEGDT